MKSGFVKRLLSIVLAVALFSGHIMPVMAEGSATVSGNSVVDTEVSTEETQETVVEETVPETEISTEEATEEIVESTDEVVEETTEEVVETEEESVSETEIPEETTEEADESVSMNEIPDEEVPLEDSFWVSLEPVTVNGITITVSGPASAFADGTTVSAVEVEPAEVVIEAAEAEQEALVKRYKAFDINLVCNGEFVQPLNGQEITVNFEGDLIIPDTEKEEVVVYHVDDNDEITKMEAEVAPMETEGEAEAVETVEMTTTHFSTYVIMITGEEGKVEVTVNHHLIYEVEEKKPDGTKEVVTKTSRLYVSNKQDVERGGTISNFIKGDGDYNVESIFLGESEIELDENETYRVDVEEDAIVIDVYYTPIMDTFNAPVVVYDYVNGRAEDSNSINYYKNYDDYVDNTSQNYGQGNKYVDRDKEIDKTKWSGRLSTKMSDSKSIIDYKLEKEPTIGGDKTYVNFYEERNHNGKEYLGLVVEGLLSGVLDRGYGAVDFAYGDPGFFTSEGTGKNVYDKFSLNFQKNGLEYTLTDVSENGSPLNVALDDFWPLDHKDNDIYNHNEFFGIRQNFEFKIGDYVGDMWYEFSGDDDLWVCLDGEVILDLGGIHQIVEGKVDIWEVLTGYSNSTYQQRKDYLDETTNAIKNGNIVHVINVIYMERGGSKSNCNMKYVMPFIIPTEPNVDTAPRVNVELLKVDATDKETVVNGAGFTLYTDPECKVSLGHEMFVDENGKVVFPNLRERTYYIKETTFPENYVKNNNVYVVQVDVDSNNRATATVTLNTVDGEPLETETNGKAFKIENTPIRDIDLEFVKVDADTNAPLAGATFTLESEDEEFDTREVTTTNDGIVKFEDIGVGTYILKEKQAPDGYTISTDEVLTIAVSYNEITKRLEYAVTEAEGNVWLDYEKQGENENALHLIKNTKTVTVIIEKDWKAIDGSELTEDELEKLGINSIEVQLYRTLKTDTPIDIKNAEGESVGEIIKLTAENDWTITIDDLDFKSASGEWQYFAKEVLQGNAKFEVSYATPVIMANNKYNVTLGIINEQLAGDLQITKTVDRVDSIHGIATFTFKIECPDGKILYRSLSFETGGTQSIIIEDLPLGEYTVTELSALRYEMVGMSSDNLNENGKIVMDSTNGAAVSFTNKKNYDDLFSHSDVIVNKVTFERNADGEIIKAKYDQVKTSTTEPVKEYQKGE